MLKKYIFLLVAILFSNLLTFIITKKYFSHNVNLVMTKQFQGDIKGYCICDDACKKALKLSRDFELDQHIVYTVFRISEQEKVDPLLMLSLIKHESGFKPNIVSPKSYYGLMQIPWNVPWNDINILIGIRIFKEKLKRANGDFYKALHYYKGYRVGSDKGEIRVRKVLSDWKEYKRSYYAKK